jgi:hypothetical protein
MPEAGSKLVIEIFTHLSFSELTGLIVTMVIPVEALTAFTIFNSSFSLCSAAKCEPDHFL